MEATMLDLRKHPKRVLSAIESNEHVTLTYRGRKKAVIVPCHEEGKRLPVRKHAAFGMWKDREDMADVKAFVRDLRKGRHL